MSDLLYSKRLEIENFGPFKGKHAVDLVPGVYAVTAERDGEPDRSNWVGKSWFLSTLPFSLLGWHMADNEDGVIHDGSKSAVVRHFLSDGTEIERARRKTTQLKIKLPGKKEQKGPEAQRALLEHLGLSEADYFATSFFEQKKISRIVTMEASERQELVRQWLDLGRLEDCEERAWELAKQADEAERQLVAKDKAVDDFWDRVGEQCFPGNMFGSEEVRPELVKLQAVLDQGVRIAEQELARAASAHGYTLQVDAALRFRELDVEGQRKRAALDLMPVVTDDDIQKAEIIANDLRSQYGAKKQDHERALEASYCRFDGKCPVAGIDCPAKDKINGNLDEAIAHTDKLTAETNALIWPMHEAEDAAQQLRDQQRARDRAVAELDALRKQALKAREGFRGSADALINGDPPQGEQDPAEHLRAAKAEHTRAVDAAGAVRRAIEEGDRLEAARASAEERAKAARALAAARASAKIFRKAQRVVAERGMARVERMASADLDAVGSGLRVQLSWSRDGSTLAGTCGECGAPFGKSAKVKVCERCAAPRGPAQIERLEVALSDWSGAAEDMAGIALQLAAASWLRDRRAARWAGACIDEPFGALDQANKRAVSQQLVGMLARRGFVQAFVVAHDRAIMAALPRSIRLVGGREGTRIG